MTENDIEESKNNFIVSIGSWHGEKAAERVIRQNNGIMIRAISVSATQNSTDIKLGDKKQE